MWCCILCWHIIVNHYFRNDFSSSLYSLAFLPHLYFCGTFFINNPTVNRCMLDIEHHKLKIWRAEQQMHSNVQRMQTDFEATYNFAWANQSNTKNNDSVVRISSVDNTERRKIKLCNKNATSQMPHLLDYTVVSKLGCSYDLMNRILRQNDRLLGKVHL